MVMSPRLSTQSYVHRNLLFPAQIDHAEYRVDVDGPGRGHGDEGAEDEYDVEVVSRKGEERDAEVREDEVFGHEVERLEELPRPLLGLEREVVEGVVGLEDAAEEHRHDPRHLRDLGEQVARVAHQHEERRLQQGSVSHSRELDAFSAMRQVEFPIQY